MTTTKYQPSYYIVLATVINQSVKTTRLISIHLNNADAVASLDSVGQEYLNIYKQKLEAEMNWELEDTDNHVKVYDKDSEDLYEVKVVSFQNGDSFVFDL